MHAGKPHHGAQGSGNLPCARVVDSSVEGFAIEATGEPEKLDEFIEVMRSYGETDVSRSGGVAMSLEARKLRLQPPVPAPVVQTI